MAGNSFTTRYTEKSRVLKNEIQVYSAISAAANADKWVALWDTGATGSCISHKVVVKLGLLPVSIKTARTPQGSFDAPCYYINLILPNGVKIEKLQVMECVPQDWDLLIGMDIISRGDFAVSNHEDRTVFSFRMPSLDEMDFVNNSYLHPVVKQGVAPGRNSPCPCGSGKKYKNCCGKYK
jgi:Predicted metal-binding protein related to the C-terminal domain of SecA